MARPRVLVTGATGFVGQSLVRQALHADWEVLALVYPGDKEATNLGQNAAGKVAHLHLLEGSITNIEGWQREAAAFRPEACVHLAWTTTPGSYLDTPENLVWLSASNDLYARLPQWGVKHVVGAGTCAEYDAEHGYLREPTPTRPETLYAASKLATRLIGRQLA
ncbi:MAG TPA: NAD-dependent epimerase/dehydratase family protein, partial [Polyangia bacterium]